MEQEQADFLSHFPKKRPALPAEYARIYDNHIIENREAGTQATRWSSRLEQWMHAKAASAGSMAAPRILELGAGNLNHLPYEPGAKVYDVVEPFERLYRNSPHRGRVAHFYDDISRVPASERYDKIVSIAVLEHLEDLPRIVARVAKRLAEGGRFCVGIPSEGTPLWTLGWKLTTGREFRKKHGLDYSVLMRHEHVNTAREIERVLRIFFSRVSVSCLGVAKSLSLYQHLECSQPRLHECERYLSG